MLLLIAMGSGMLKFALSTVLAVYSAMLVAAPHSFITVSDIHFNPYAGCTASPCPVVQALVQAPADSWAQILSQSAPKVFSAYGSDSNYTLLQSTVNEIGTVDSKAQFVLVLGDLLAHHYQENYIAYTGDKSEAGYQAFVGKTMAFLSDEFKLNFPHTPVYMVLGNNDSDLSDYGVIPNGQLYHEMAEDFSSLVDEANRTAFINDYSQAAYYSVNLPGGNQILVLNSVLFSPKANSLAGVNLAYYAEEELAWLDSQLAAAQARHHQVWIVGHIPIGVDVYSTISASTTGLNIVGFWQDAYIHDYLQIIQGYPQVIQGHFAGHLHMDGMGLVGTSSFMTLVPGISPEFGNNPGFKVYQYNPKDLSLLDYQTYSLNLKNTDPTWKLEYDFNKVYPQGIDLERSIKHLIRSQTLQRGELSQQYQQFYAVSSPGSQPIESKWLPYYWCGMNTVSIKEYQICYGKYDTANIK